MMTYWQNKISSDIKKECNSEPVYNHNFLKTIILSYSNEATDFQDKGIPKAASDYTCLAVISNFKILLLKKMKTIICKFF